MPNHTESPMVESIWRFYVDVLDDQSLLAPVISAIAETPGLAAQRYDLNRKDQWRTFDLERVRVDLLTQRTQFVRIDGKQDQVEALIAMGKRGEQPTVIVRLSDDCDVHALVDRWPDLYDGLALDQTLVSSTAWRRALDAADLAPGAVGGLSAMVFGWRQQALPDGFSDFEAAITQSGVLETSAIRITHEPNHVQLHLADTPQVGGDAHRRGLELASSRLFGRGSDL